MIHLGVSRRDQRTLAIGAATISLLLAGSRGVPALRSWEENQAMAAEAVRSELGRVRSGAMLLPTLRESLAVRRMRLARIDSTLLSGPSPSAIAADLASNLEDLADDTSVRVTALQLHADTVVVARIARAEVRITGIADIVGLGAFLRAVDAGPSMLAVRELSVSQQDPGGSDSKPEALRVDVLVSGIGLIKATERNTRP